MFIYSTLNLTVHAHRLSNLLQLIFPILFPGSDSFYRAQWHLVRNLVGRLVFVKARENRRRSTQTLAISLVVENGSKSRVGWHPRSPRQARRNQNICISTGLKRI